MNKHALFINLLTITHFTIVYSSSNIIMNKSDLDSSPTIQCQNLTSCFDCNNPDRHCQWIDSNCLPSINEEKWINKLLQCNDKDSRKSTEKYCHLATNKKRDTYYLKPSKDEMDSGLFCKFSIDVNSKRVLISIHRSFRIYLGIEIIHYLDSLNEFDDNIPQNKEFETNDVKEMNIFYYGNLPREESLFGIKVLKLSKSIGNTYIFIVILCCAVIFVGLMVAFILFLFHYLKNKQIKKDSTNVHPFGTILKQSNQSCGFEKKSKVDSTIDVGTEIEDKSSNKDDKNQYKDNKDSIILQEISFDSERMKLFNEKCPLCLDKIEKESKIIISACFHGFHGKCMNTWVQNNKPNVFCPICHCKFNILSKDQIPR